MARLIGIGFFLFGLVMFLNPNTHGDTVAGVVFMVIGICVFCAKVKLRS